MTMQAGVGRIKSLHIERDVYVIVLKVTFVRHSCSMCSDLTELFRGSVFLIQNRQAMFKPSQPVVLILMNRLAVGWLARAQVEICYSSRNGVT